MIFGRFVSNWYVITAYILELREHLFYHSNEKVRKDFTLFQDTYCLRRRLEDQKTLLSIVELYLLLGSNIIWDSARRLAPADPQGPVPHAMSHVAMSHILHVTTVSHGLV